MPKTDAVRFPSTADYNLIDLFSITSLPWAGFFLGTYRVSHLNPPRELHEEERPAALALVWLIKIFKETLLGGDIQRNLWHTLLGAA
jgi:hypothetical protein